MVEYWEKVKEEYGRDVLVEMLLKVMENISKVASHITEISFKVRKAFPLPV